MTDILAGESVDCTPTGTKNLNPRHSKYFHWTLQRYNFGTDHRYDGYLRPWRCFIGGCKVGRVSTRDLSFCSSVFFRQLFQHVPLLTLPGKETAYRPLKVKS